MVKPILKWVGGKTQILDKVLASFPKRMANYHEIFLGGGSVLLGLLSAINEGTKKVSGTIYAYDVNSALIHVYKNVQSRPDELFTVVNGMTVAYKQSASKNEVYHTARAQFNSMTDEEQTTVLGSALFIFLNKTCFRGLYRTSKNGFNVAFGHYDNPEIVNRDHLMEVSHLIRNVVFECCDFSKSLAQVGKGDFVYLDPPYAPETASSFVGYTAAGFGIEQHKMLFDTLNQFTKDSKFWLMSNADVTLVRDHFQQLSHSTESIVCKRSINAKNPASKAIEVLVKNFVVIVRKSN